MNGRRAKKLRKLTAKVFADITKPEDYRKVYQITKKRFRVGRIPA